MFGVVFLFGLVGALGVVLVCAVLLYTIYVGYIHWKYSHIPSPERPSFYFGHLNDVWKWQKEIDEELCFSVMVDYWAKKVESPVFVVFMGYLPTVISLDPEVIQVICMNKHNPKPKIFSNGTHSSYGKRFLGDGLISERNYARWKPRRAFYDPAFKKSYLKTLVGAFNETTTSLIDELKPMANGRTIVPIKQHIQNFALNVVSKIAFGYDFSEQWSAESLGVVMPEDSGGNVMHYILEQSMKALHKNFTSPLPKLNQYLYPSEAKVYRSCISALRKIGKDCIMRRMQMIEAREEVPQDILSCILSSSSDNPDVEVLVDDFCTFFAAGQDTVANTLLFALILLAQHPNVLERLQQEIEEVLGQRTFVSSEDLEELLYTDQVMNETFRLHPVADSVTKTLAETTVIGKYSFPAGTDFYMSFGNISRLPQYFHDPDTFNPDRFHPDNKKPSSYIFSPFGIGHRSCIGKPLAIMEVKIALARLLQTFHVEIPSDYEIRAIQRVNLRLKGNLNCTLNFR